MLLAEEFGAAFVRDNVKVYATDFDAEALEYARQATYSHRDLEGLPPDLLDTYFTGSGDKWTLNNDLRRVVIFGRHDLLQDAPISRVDLLLCRNTLMYFNADVQSQLVYRLHFSLADGGYMLLGKVEMLLGQGELFQAIDMKQRLFRKIARSTLRHRLLAMARRGGSTAYLGTDRVIDHAFEHRASAEIVIDESDAVTAVNARARGLFGIGAEAVGGPFQDLEVSYRPVELRSSIDEARSEGRPVLLRQVARWDPGGTLSYLDVEVVPLTVEGQHAGVLISFVDVTRHRQLQEELETTHRELETAYEELQSANEELETTNEELETTNEELQSTIEELETTNEELQSTNEELETMNEELSSTNEELQAINDELRDRTTQLNDVNAYLESVLTGLEASVIVVDSDLRVRVWNGLSFDMWGVRPEEAEGRPLLALDIGFPVERLGPPLGACLAGDTPGDPIEVDARSRRGGHIRCRARVSPLRDARGAVEGAIVIISEVR
jgi:two-component system CheB/CheR fusion protein